MKSQFPWRICAELSERFARFDMIRILSLPHRLDRRNAVQRELCRLGLTIDDGRVAFLDAIRPMTADGFDSIGARGCFLSHLAALRSAKDADVSYLLVLEDDVAFSRAERKAMETALYALSIESWDVFYGGSLVNQQATPLTVLSSDAPVQLAHFIAFSRNAIHILIPHLEAMLTRPTGSAEGGPMHVDGAYSHFRRDNPGIVAVAATPPIAHQRASRTDIHTLGFLDRNKGLRLIAAVFRSLKNMVASWK